jgi:hypothetical protein
MNDEHADKPPRQHNRLGSALARSNKPVAGSSRRLVRGKWVEASADTSMFSALVKAINKQPRRKG